MSVGLAVACVCNAQMAWSAPIVLLNNARWEMLQAFFPDARYNSTVAGRSRSWLSCGAGAVSSPGRRELRHGLQLAWSGDRFALIEVALQPGDVSPILRGFVRAFKERVHQS
jgi:hypothetical protein